MRSIILGLVLLAGSALASAADNFVLWDNDTFSAPFTDGVVATSAVINNTSGANAIKIHVAYGTVTHGGAVSNVCPCDIRAVIEEEISSGVWIPVANQFEGWRILDNGQERVLELSPGIQFNPGADMIVELPDGSDLRVSRTQGVAPEKMRVRILVREDVAGILQSLTVSAEGRKFSE